jgi:hypothetical protein
MFGGRGLLAQWASRLSKKKAQYRYIFHIARKRFCEKKIRPIFQIAALLHLPPTQTKWRSLKTPAAKVRGNVEIIYKNNALYSVILKALSISKYVIRQL